MNIQKSSFILVLLTTNFDQRGKAECKRQNRNVRWKQFTKHWSLTNLLWLHLRVLHALSSLVSLQQRKSIWNVVVRLYLWSKFYFRLVSEMAKLNNKSSKGELSVYGASVEEINVLQQFLDICYKLRFISIQFHIRSLLQKQHKAIFQKAKQHDNHPLTHICK